MSVKLHHRTSSESNTSHTTKSRRREFLELGAIFVIAFALVLGVVRPALMEPYNVSSPSMEPTLEVHDSLLANKFVYNFSDTDPQRGDIVLFESAEGPDGDPLAKRVVGLAGDTVALVGEGKLVVNGEPQREPYIQSDPCVSSKPKTCSFGPVEVPEDQIFVMGDNRANSYDSRFFGPVPEEDLIGEAFLRFWPSDRMGAL